MNTQILIGLFICHFLADYTHLSTAWMLNAKRLGRPLFPIFCHAWMHAILMGFFLIVYSNHISTIEHNAWFSVVGFQTLSHFLIDVWKGRMNGWFPTLQNPANKWHWVVFGFGQLLHAIVIILMVNWI